MQAGRDIGHDKTGRENQPESQIVCLISKQDFLRTNPRGYFVLWMKTAAAED